MGLPLNQVVPNCAPNHLRLTALDKYRCVPHHQHQHYSSHHRRRHEHPPSGASRRILHAPSYITNAFNTNTDSQHRRAPAMVHQHQSRNSLSGHSTISSYQSKQQLMDKFKLNIAKSRLKLKELTAPQRRPRDSSRNNSGGDYNRNRLRASDPVRRQHDVRIQSNVNRIQYFKNSTPIVSNMPLINIQNSSILLINDSPFGLRDKRFGLLHHLQPSETYYS